MSRRRPVWSWLGRAVALLVIAALAVYLYAVGLDAADKLASASSLLVALVALLYPYLFRSHPKDEVEPPAPPALPPSEPLFHSAYLEYVRQVAPAELHDRDYELNQLAAFCTTDAGSYRRWVGTAWTGKSALLAWFVLHPPQGVDVVSFFINSRLNPHYNREAFIDGVTEQLAELLGRALSTTGPPITRVARLQRLLVEAVATCGERGRRLVLVVDGLDEDRVVTPEKDIYSIAAMLPERPPPGLKIVVAGRPDPPLPQDVPAHHPLRDPAIVRLLEISPHAKTNEYAANLELRTLLQNEFSRDLLGLVTAAGGGLSAADLAELTDHSTPEVRDFLAVSSGRTFSSRPATLRPATAPGVYALAHDELRAATLSALDLSPYRTRLQAWANLYRSRSWPDTTPEYLLRGYLGMLLDTPSIDQAVSLVVDAPRHQRILRLTGGDHAALMEIAGVRAVLLSEERPDLAGLSLLALHRNELEESSANIPRRLPAVWAQLGDFAKADSLAGGITRQPDSRQDAIRLVLEVAIARQEIPWLEATARQSEFAPERMDAFVALIRAAGAAGDLERVDALIDEALTASFGEAEERLSYRLVVALAQVGRSARAEEILDSRCKDSVWRASGLARLHESVDDLDPERSGRLWSQMLELLEELPVERVWGVFGGLERSPQLSAHPDRLQALLRSTEPRIERIQSCYQRARELVRLADICLEQGDRVDAERLAGEAERALPGVADPEDRRFVLSSLLNVISQFEDEVRVRSVLDRHLDLYQDAAGQTGGDKSVGLVVTLWSAGLVERAQSLLDKIDLQADRDRALGRIVRYEYEPERFDRAEAIAGTIVDPDEQLAALQHLARVAARAGQGALASRVIDRAEPVVRREDHTRGGWEESRFLSNLADLAFVAAVIGDIDRATRMAQEVETVVRTHPAQDRSNHSLGVMVDALAAAGAYDRAQQLSDLVSVDSKIGSVRGRLVARLAKDGFRDRAEAILRANAEELWLGDWLRLLRARAEARETGPTAVLARELYESLATEEHYNTVRHWLASVAGYVALAGNTVEALELVRSIDDSGFRARVILGLCEIAVDQGNHQLAAECCEMLAGSVYFGQALAARAKDPGPSATSDQIAALIERAALWAEDLPDPAGKVSTYLDAALAAVATGTPDRAVELALLGHALVCARPAASERDQELRQVVQVLVGARAYDRIWPVIGDMSDDYSKKIAVEKVLAGLAADGQTEQCRHWIADLETESTRSEMLQHVAKKLAEAGDYHQAAFVLQESGDGSGAASALEAVLKASIEVADLDFTEATLTSLASSGGGRISRRQLVEGWSVMVAAATAHGDPRASNWADHAETIADEIAWPEEHAEALVDLAKGTPPSRAHSLVARALSDGAWDGPVAVIAEIDPEALIRLADALIDRMTEDEES